VTEALALAWLDLRMLFRTGYLAVAVVIFLVLWGLISQLSQLDFAGFADFVAAVILVDAVALPLLLVGLMLLLERGDGCLAVLAVTPMRRASFLVARTGVVALVCAAQMLLLVLLEYDAPLSPVPLAAGLLGIAAIAALTGVVAVALFRSMQAYILPCIGWMTALSLPGYGRFAGIDPLWLAWHPMAPPMALLEAAFAPQPAWRLVYGAAGVLLWLGVAGAAASRALRAMMLRLAGG
jgi:hypothetical protein